MMPQAEGNGLNHEELDYRRFEDVQLFAQPDGEGGLVEISAVDEDSEKIRRIADRLFRLGYGVMRERSPRSGRVYYTLKATWADAGPAPEDPLGAATGHEP